MFRKRSFDKSQFSIKTVINECIKTVKNVDTRVLSAVVTIVMLLSSFGIVTKYFTFGYDVYYGDINVGVTDSKEKAIEVYNEAEEAVEECNRSGFLHDLKFVMTIIPVSRMAQSDIFTGIVEAAEGKEKCFAVTVKGTTVVRLKTLEEAQEAMDLFTESFSRSDASICVNYAIAPDNAIVTEIFSVEDAVGVIRESGMVTVCYTEVEDESVELPFKETIIEDETLPEGTSVCEQEGSVGYGVNTTKYYVNGLGIEKTEAELKVVVEPVERIVYKGTGEMVGLPEKSLAWPTTGVFTSDFGRRWGRNHNGIDIAAETGTPIYAPCGGIVTFSGTKSGYGNYVIIDHGEGYETTYAHMSTRYVEEGSAVRCGDMIGTVGVTGRVTGSHLHFEILLNGRYVDPMKYIAG